MATLPLPALYAARANSMYPESMDAIFEEAAQAYDVPVALLKAVGKAESGFDANDSP